MLTISSISNFIAISPPGFISVSGFGINSINTEFIEELGINIQLFRVGEYKGAAETYVRNDFSEENKEQYLNHIIEWSILEIYLIHEKYLKINY